MGITSRLAAFAATTSFSDIPGKVIDRSKEMMLNAAAVGLAGSRHKEGQIITQFVRQIGGEPQCTIIGAGIRSSSVNAALANGTMVHVLDYDEAILRRGNHPSNVIFPVVMALGEQMSLHGRDVVAAFAVGCEVSTKIGAAGDLDEMDPSMSSVWHLMGVAGPIGAAAAAGRLLGLDQERMQNALAIAVSQAAGVRANIGTSTKSLHCGQAAMHGVMAAMLAQQGFTGASDAIEGAKGFLACYRRDINVDEHGFIHRLGNPYDVIDPGLALKLYPCSSNTHTSIDALLNLVEKHHISPEQVQAIGVSAPPEAGVAQSPLNRPKTGMQGKFSLAYCMAVALVHGQPRIHHFTDEALKDSRVMALADKVTVKATEPATKDISRPSTVTLSLAGGREVSCRIEHPKGHPSNPLSAQELDDKFSYCSHDVLPPDQIQSVIARFRRLEVLPDVQPFFSSLGGTLLR